MKASIILTVLLLSFNALAQNYWMPRETLKNNLSVYIEPDSSSQVICAVSQGRAIKHIEEVGKWLKISISLCNGYVYKPSVIPFKTNLTYIQGLVADEIEIHRVDKTIYFDVGGWCYFINLDNLRDIPTGKENALTLRDHLDSLGGMGELTDEIKINCNFH